MNMKNQLQNLNWLEVLKKMIRKIGEAIVPGCVHLDLFNNRLIQDPFYGTNEKDLQWISDKDWNYKLTLSQTQIYSGQEKILLNSWL